MGFLVSYIYFIFLEQHSDYPYAKRALTLSGYYSNSRSNPRTFLPDDLMTAFAVGDTVAAGSYYDGEQLDSSGQDVVQPDVIEENNATPIDSGNVPLESQTSSPEVSRSTETIPFNKPSDNPKRSKAPLNPYDDTEDGDDEQHFWPFSRGGQPSYNSFFPILIGGQRGGIGRSQDSESSVPGTATAIANSFSTGKGGVASSHATSIGDPYFSMLLRKSLFNRKSNREE